MSSFVFYVFAIAAALLLDIALGCTTRAAAAGACLISLCAFADLQVDRIVVAIRGRE
jgi:hypothetical protein